MTKSWEDLVDKGEYSNILVVDGLNLAFRYLHNKSKNFAADYLRTVSSLANSYSANKIIITSDAGSSYRKEIYPEYKANRQVLRDKQTEQEAQDFKEFLDEFNKALELASSKYLVLKYSGVEADDIIAYICNNQSPKYSHIWVVSSDKDLDQLVNEKVSRFSYITRKEITADNWEEHYSYDREHHISIKVLMGDAGDNVKGIDGVGIKRAEMLVRQYGSALDIYDAIPLEGKQKFIQSVNNFKDTILLNYELMDLNTYYNSALGLANMLDIENKLQEYL